MAAITITEALAEIPTIEKRIEKKREFVLSFLFRVSAARDPHEKDGGSAVLITREMQAIKDLQERAIHIRAAIQKANAINTIAINGTSRTIVDWLTWRREIVAKQQAFLASMVDHLTRVRKEAAQRGVAVSEQDKGVSADVVVNVNELELAKKIEELEIVLGTLDGQLSLKNATITVDV